MDPEQLPWWMAVREPESIYGQVLREMWQQPAFAQHVTQAMAPEGASPFVLSIGGRGLYESLPPATQRATPWNEEFGAATFFNANDRAANTAGIAFDEARILAAAGQDSARARELMRDAILHEFAHVLPVAQSRNVRDQTGDPRPGAHGLLEHPVIRGENQLRGLLGLQPKRFYGLLNETP